MPHGLTPKHAVGSWTRLGGGRPPSEEHQPQWRWMKDGFQASYTAPKDYLRLTPATPPGPRPPPWRILPAGSPRYTVHRGSVLDNVHGSALMLHDARACKETAVKFTVIDFAADTFFSGRPHAINQTVLRDLAGYEELELPYELKKYDRGPKCRSPPELEHLTPLGKVPVLTDGDIALSEAEL
ncbi:hypothetical protein HYDPIDRAFT_191044 [Hydnomerulius pinastri MD-312]|uniref:GST N-terminal domain-containing protein n=1 Tax=Hydnomerulius pinastri MD-312 TaxID=994086 RepID=A0A0C2PR11_9AGAM|nr:hypothetical protein HYDPIDRAFT_191044 [Hydnomerulius pinastri MD-312]